MCCESVAKSNSPRHSGDSPENGPPVTNGGWSSPVAHGTEDEVGVRVRSTKMEKLGGFVKNRTRLAGENRAWSVIGACRLKLRSEESSIPILLDHPSKT